MAFFSVPLFVAAITALPPWPKAAMEPPLALVVLTINWRLADPVAQLSQFGGGNIRADEVELILLPVERPVADQNQHEVIFGLGLPGDDLHHCGKIRPRSVLARHREHVVGRTPHP